MCGIAGYYRYATAPGATADVETGLRMVDAITHRGPDDGGLLAMDRLLLGFRRLSILDLSPDGHQPMTDEHEECWIVFNGEIYNFGELRTELEAAGHRFRSRTDTEVILRGYLQWGGNVAQRLNGMFAFVLYDRRDESLWLVRDPIGIKPLFYRHDGAALWFGSEIKAILADPQIPRRPDLEGLDQFLTFGYTPAPRTGFEGISQLEPGEQLVVRGGVVNRSRWYSLPYPPSPGRGDLAECTERLGAALDAAVARQMVSDVPLGALLSGGLDSSAVVRSMRRSGVADIDTFTIAFGDASFDESPYAARVAERYQTRHHVAKVAEEAADLLPMLVSHAEEPFADNSMIPFFRLAEHVRRHVTVALSGDGADELLAGYMTYQASARSPLYRMLPRVLRRGMIEPLVRMFPGSTQKYGVTSLLRRFTAAAGRPFPYDHCSWRRIVSAELREELYSPQFQRAVSPEPLQGYVDALDGVPDWATPLEQQLHLDLRFHLPNDMLVKVDRMSMAHALEVRVPFLDLEVVAACLAMPADVRYRRGDGKRPLKALLARDLPSDIVHRKKGGFLAPVEQWLRGPWQPLLRRQLSAEFIAATGLLDGRVVTRLIDETSRGRGDHAYTLFTLLVLSLWWETWINGNRVPNFVRRPAAPTRVHRLTVGETR